MSLKINILNDFSDGRFEILAKVKQICRWVLIQDIIIMPQKIVTHFERHKLFKGQFKKHENFCWLDIYSIVTLKAMFICLSN